MMCFYLQLNVPLILNDLYLLRYLCKKQLLLNKSFSGVDNTYPKRLRMKFSAQLTPFFIAHVYSEWLIYCFLAMHLCDLVFLFPLVTESIVQVLLGCHVLFHSLCCNPIGMGHIPQHFEDGRLYLL